MTIVRIELDFPGKSSILPMKMPKKTLNWKCPVHWTPSGIYLLVLVVAPLVSS